MGQKLSIVPIGKGLKTDKLAFNIDNDSFPVLVNAYQWRDRVKRKRGTSLLGRLQRFFNSTSVSYNSGSTTITLDGGGNGNILTGFSLQTNGNIVPGSVTLVGSAGPVTYTDPTKDGFLTPTGTSGPNTINYATGAVLIPVQSGSTLTATFTYYPDLPVLGIEDLNLNATQFPGTLGFDTTYSYNILKTSPYTIYDVSFYKNPVTGTYPGYIQKANVTPTSWNGQTYQQFWTTNYEGALWATNGISVPFANTNIGMQYKNITGVVINAVGPPALATLTIVAHGLVQGDFVFINEVIGITGINFQTGYVVSADPQAANTVQVEFPNAVLGGVYSSGGIAQYLTNRSDVTKDCLRWYDGDPTDGTSNPPVLNGHLGWVNFCPPLSQLSFPISDEISQQYYLVGARLIVPFKDRLLFFGPVVQTSVSGSQIYLQDTVVYSQNGTPFYTASFDGSKPISAQTIFTPILAPTKESAAPNAYWEDVTGLGGSIAAGFAQPIITVSPNEDVLIIGFSSRQARMVYSGNDIIPFNFFVINSEMGSSSTFSIINFDRGVSSVGNHGIVITAQVGSERMDLDIPDQLFQFNLTNNGLERVTAQRDFINEWVYYSYLSNNNNALYVYPNQTFQYNYRDKSWAIFNESYTTYGQFTRQTGETWATLPYSSWEAWTDPWNAGESTLLQPQVVGGNQQGFILIRGEGTGEGNSLYIQSFSGNLVTAPDHCLNDGDYIIISGCIGTVGALVNNNIFSVYNSDKNTFRINPSIVSATYSGGGVIKRMYIPLILTRQFPVYWEMARKTRIGFQQYLLSTTSNGQIQLLIFLSQDANNAYNAGNIVPTPATDNNALIYSTVLYTCPESTNIGLTAANTNLQMPTAIEQQQIWHRLNTSLIGDTVQLGFTMSDTQMRDITLSNQFSEIEIHAINIDLNPSSMLS